MDLAESYKTKWGLEGKLEDKNGGQPWSYFLVYLYEVLNNKESILFAVLTHSFVVS